MDDLYQPLAICLTLLVALLTQYFAVTHEIEHPDGKPRKKITKWGICALFLMILGAVISFQIHIEDQAQQQEQQLSRKQFEQKTIESLQETVTYNNTMVKEWFPRIESTCNRTTNEVLLASQLTHAQLELINSQLKLGIEACDSERDNAEIEKLAEQINRLKAQQEEAAIAETTSVPTRFHYTVSMSKLDVNQCQNQAAQGFYWDMTLNNNQFTQRQPGNVANANNGMVELNAEYQFQNIQSPEAQFVMSGYIRELTGRSLIRRYYQYRYPGTFSEVIRYEKVDNGTQVIDFTFDANGSDNASNCQFRLIGQITRKKANDGN